MAIVNHEQVARVAAFLRANPPKTSGMNFYSVQTSKGEMVLDTMYPWVGHPRVLDFFFFACLHDHGFWYGDDRGYVEPMFGSVGGKKLKGSDLLWTLLKRKLDADPDFFDLESGRLQNVTSGELSAVLADDIGTQWPHFEQRLALTQAYARSMTVTPKGIVAASNEGSSMGTLWNFLYQMRRIRGFDQDNLEKRQLLLAMMLANRPEKFLKVSEQQAWPPIVDYHLMRVALRLGLVELGWEPRQENSLREWTESAWERNIRKATFDAVSGIIKESGLSMAVIDETLWMARKYCPEMTEPECDKCMFASVCAKRTELFQPVFRTTAY